MKILGISDSITSGAALVVDGELVAAVNEERLNRQKMSMGFPNLSILEVLRIAKLHPSEIDKVAVATESLFWRPDAVPFTDYFREKKGDFRDNFLSLGSLLSPFFGKFSLARSTYQEMKKRLTFSRHENVFNTLKHQIGIQAPISFLDHHFCHAASAYYTSGFSNALVVTMDGAGDGKCSRVYNVKKGAFEELTSIDSYHSVGNYYAYITHLCGFKAHKHEGKITGLAAMGKPIYKEMLKEFIFYQEGQIENVGKCFDQSAISKLEKKLPNDFSKADLSASIQEILEESVSSYCSTFLKRTRQSNIALAGGVFANVKLNQRINELDETKNIFIHPGMGDEGLAVGAALSAAHADHSFYSESMIKDVYLGDDFSDHEIHAVISKYNCPIVEYSGSIEEKVAGLLADGKVIGRFSGRMEYGPRALGNRSILYQPTDASVNDWLNKRLSRTEFMPFAPVTLWKERERCYRNIKGAGETARFMTITFDCTDWMLKHCPAVCHVDGTARPQLIKEEDNSEYYRIVENYFDLTGLPCIINTSFNMHEEPIVNTPEDAIRSFIRGHLDFLAIGSFLLSNPQPAT